VSAALEETPRPTLPSAAEQLFRTGLVREMNARRLDRAEFTRMEWAEPHREAVAGMTLRRIQAFVYRWGR
jgi:hypothetical protein